MTETLMPGGGVARRPLHFILLADCSGSAPQAGATQVGNIEDIL